MIYFAEMAGGQRMKRHFLFATLSLSVIFAGPVIAQINEESAPATEPATNTPEKTKSVSGWNWWSNRFQAEMDYLDRTNYWGNATSQLPKGLLGFKYSCNLVQGGDQWDMNGHSVGGVLPLIDGDFGSMGSIRLDPRATGGAAFHSIQVSYGITDAWDVYIKIPFMHLKVDLDPMFESSGAASALFGTTLEDFYKTIEKFGRPRPKRHYETSGVEMADIDFGASWQFYRSKYFAAALTGRVYVPTGRLANPDRMIYALLGPELDAGKGGWGLGFSAAFDVRMPIPKKTLKYIDIILSGQVDFQQRFPYKRRFPHFTKPDYSSIASWPAEATAGIQSFFPDVSDDAGREFTVYPGSIFGMMASTQFTFFRALTVGVEYDYIAAMPSIVKGLHDAGWKMMSSTLFAGGVTEHHLQIGLSTGALMALSIPLVLRAKYEWMFAGTNTMPLTHNWSFGFEMYLPVIMPDEDAAKKAHYTK